MLGDTADNRTVLQTVSNLELQEFLHLRYYLTFQYGSHTDIELFKVFERDSRLDRIRLISSGFVGFLRIQQFLYLCLDDAVFNLFEQQFRLIQCMSGAQQVGASQLFPFEGFHVQHLTQFLTAERQERFEGDGQVGNQLQRNVQNSSYTLHVCLGQFPRFCISQILITDTCQVHGFFLCVTELEYIQQFFYFCLNIRKFLQGFLIVIGQFPTSRYLAVKIFMSQYQRTVHEVTVYSYQLIVVACLEILPGEVIVFGFRSIGSQHIAQHILFAREILQIFVQPHSPVA